MNWTPDIYMYVCMYVCIYMCVCVCVCMYVFLIHFHKPPLNSVISIS